MKLSISTVNNLIRELSSVIDYDLNIMDENGIIISSTDPERIGCFHEGALLIIKNQLNRLQVNYDNEYEGCREGANVPLIVDHEIIGVLGITGQAEETSKYTSIIKKTAEILLKDYFNLEQAASWNQARLFFLNSWLNREITERDRVQRKLRQYKCPATSKWQIIVVDNIKSHDITRRFLNERIKTARAVTSWNNTHGIIIGMFETSEEAGEYIEFLLQSTPDRDSFIFAVGNTVDDEMLAPRSYEQALSLIQYVQKKKHAADAPCSGIVFYKDHIMDIALYSIPEALKDEIISDVFKSCRQSDILPVCTFILNYCSNNGSINKLAESLYMHKNTVQYKIHKIQRLTGLDLRITEDMVRLRAAAQLYLTS